MKYVIATTKKWNIENFFKHCNKKEYFLIRNRRGLNLNKLKKIKPSYIFFPHWSWVIPKEIWSNFICIVFHMTDLPYGRGGTPLQNLISRGHKNTKISAIKVDKGIDTGDVYLKEDLDLAGSAEEIYEKLSEKIFTKMIPYIIKKKPVPKKQEGRVTLFQRRRPEESKVGIDFDKDKIYDHIRMLDAEGYPKAFMETNKLKLEFFAVKKRKDKLIAKVEIYEK
jgi:methionyl-tRNA formyltransferase